MAITDKVLNKFSQRRWGAYRDIFNLDSPQAKEVLKDMCAAHHVFDAGFDSDPIELARMAGERNVVLRILTILKATPEDIFDLAPEKEDTDDS